MCFIACAPATLGCDSYAAAEHGRSGHDTCAVQGVFEFLEKQGKAPTPVGLQVVLHGQVPTGKHLHASPHFL